MEKSKKTFKWNNRIVSKKLQCWSSSFIQMDKFFKLKYKVKFKKKD